jgi:sugar lactone lactonase YvrE
VRLFTLAALVALLAACLASAGTGTRVTLTAQRTAVVGAAWTGTLRVTPASAGRPSLLARRGPRSVTARTVAAGKGRFRARLVFPASGRWTFAARLGGRTFPLGAVTVRPTQRPAPPLELRVPIGLGFDPEGRLLVADNEGYRILRVDPGTGALTVAAGTGRRGATRDGALATATDLDFLFDVAADREGDLVFGTLARIRRVDAHAGTISTIAGDGNERTSGDGGPAAQAGLTQVGPLVLDPAGTIYLATSDGRIRRIDGASGVITTVVGTSEPGYSGDGGPATRAQISAPHGLVLAPDGALVFADSANHRVRRVDLETGVISTIAGDGRQAFGGDGGPAVRASFAYPAGIGYLADGTLLVVDSLNGRIRAVAPGGTIRTIVPDFGSGSDLVVDRAGLAYVTQPELSRIRRVDPATGAVTTVAGR